jgi:hypothetical protein
VRNLIPAPLHQCPRLVCEGWVRRSLRALAAHYCQHDRSRCTIVEGGRAGKRPWEYKMIVSQGSTQRRPFLTCLDHDHRESKYIRFFAISPLLVQDFWCCPSRGMTLLFRSTSHRIQDLSDPSKTKIRDPLMVVSINEDIRLGTCQHGGTVDL